jgi:hypothetical protein
MSQYRSIIDGRNIRERRHPGGIRKTPASVEAGKMLARPGSPMTPARE